MSPTKWFGDEFIQDQDLVKCSYCRDEAPDVRKRDYDEHLALMHSKKMNSKYNESEKSKTFI